MAAAAKAGVKGEGRLPSAAPLLHESVAGNPPAASDAFIDKNSIPSPAPPVPEAVAVALVVPDEDVHLPEDQRASRTTPTTVFRQVGAPENGGWRVHRPRSTSKRVILPFMSARCCEPGTGLPRGQALPEPLAARGVTAAYWENMLTRLEEEVQTKQQSVACQILCWVTLVFVPILCYQQAAYNRELQRWLDDLNDDLAPRGMYAKIQSNEVHEKDYHEMISWLAIATTPEEVQKLQAEPVVYRPKFCSTVMVPSCAQKVGCYCGPYRAV